MKSFKNCLLLLLIAMTFSNPFLRAQVIIGGLTDPKQGVILDLNSDVTGGLLLPNIRIPDLGKIPATGFVGITQSQDTNVDLVGTIVYNTDPITGPGLFIWDGDDWNRLASDGSVSVTGDSGNTEPALANGTTVNGYTVSDPSCKDLGVFTFTWITGHEYIDHLTILDAGAGRFTVKFQPNDRASRRHALLLITSPCGKSNTFVFTQVGDDNGCGTSDPIPDIQSENTLALCGGGAVYLYLTGRPSNGVYIWTLNGEEVARGAQCVATKPGKYIVYADKIGCEDTPPKSIQVTANSTVAPDPVALIVNTNNGIACGEGGTTALIVSPALNGTIYWYKDGVKMNHADYNGKDSILANKGVWQAVVEDGDCSSVLSERAVVTEDLSGGGIPIPTIKINGSTTNDEVCEGGSLYLEVANFDPLYTYVWYIDNTVIGTGTGVYYPVPSVNSMVIRLQATGSGCSKETNMRKTVSYSRAPATPSIAGNGVLCGGSTSLSVNTSLPSPDVVWYKEDTVYASGNNLRSITVHQTGEYSVTVADGSCVSRRSAIKTVSLSDFALISWVQKPVSALYGERKLYEVSGINGPINYTWKVTQNGVDITSTAVSAGQGSNYLQIQFPLSGDNVIVSVHGTNSCGDASNNDTMSVEVELTDGCITPKFISPATNQTINDAIVGSPVTMTVLAINTNTESYQWYRGDNSSIVGATSATYSYVPTTNGTATYYCIVTNGCSGTPSQTSPMFIVNVAANPAEMPRGNGTLTGKTCLDIVETASTACGTLESRRSNGVDLSKPQHYQFKAAGSGNNFRFIVIDSEECLDPSDPYIVTGIVPGTSFTAGATATLTLNFKQNLSIMIKGRSWSEAAVVKLFAVFNQSSTEVSIPLTIRIQDCMCCGAKISPTEWKDFMCHNLGADESLHPFTPNRGLLGNYYQWGRTVGLKTDNPSDYPAGWNSILATDEWRDDVKTSNDPCPPGWRVPTTQIWKDVILNNKNTISRTPSATWQRVGDYTLDQSKFMYEAGLFIGDALFLPAAGRRVTSGQLGSIGNNGTYWSTSKHISLSVSRHALYFDVSEAKEATFYVLTGFSVRCMAE